MNNFAHQICDFNLQGSPSGEAQAKHIAGDKPGFTTTSRLRPEFFSYSLVRQGGGILIISILPHYYDYIILLEGQAITFTRFKMKNFDLIDGHP